MLATIKKETEMKHLMVSVKVKNNGGGEWIVMAYNKDGDRLPALDYFTNCGWDAQDTAKSMRQAFEKRKKKDRVKNYSPMGC